MAKQTGGAWAAVELDSGAVARVPQGPPTGEGVAERVAEGDGPVAWFATERAAERFLLAVFGPEAGREWRPAHVAEGDRAAVADGRIRLDTPDDRP